MPVEFKHTAPCPFSMPVGFAISMAERNKKKNDRVRGRPVVLSPFGCEVKGAAEPEPEPEAEGQSVHVP